MPGISVSKICVPFGGGGINWSSYWTNLIGSIIMGELGFAFLTEDNDYIIQE